MYAHKHVHGKSRGGRGPGAENALNVCSLDFFILNSKKKKGDKYVYGSTYIHTVCACANLIGRGSIKA